MPTLVELIQECIISAREQGWPIDEDPYRLTRFDEEWITKMLGHEPTRAEWSAVPSAVYEG